MVRKAKSSNEPSSFFKVLIRDDFTTRLRIPHGFVNKHGSFVGAENARLRSSWGQIWDVKLVHHNDDDDEEDKYWCFIGEGWTKFVKDLEIKLGEFLLFSLHAAHSITTFDVSVYGTNCCLRQIPDMAQDLDSTNIPERDKKRRRKCEEHTKYPSFQIVMTESRKSRWCLPKKFVAESGLSGKRAVVLEYPPKQRYWGVILDEREMKGTYNYTTLDISLGWNEFRKDNGLVSGRTYSFEFHPSTNLIQVKELKHK